MQVPASQRLLGTHVQRSSDERRQVDQILRMDEDDRDQGRRLEGESRAEDASEGKREEGGDTVSHGEPAGRESHDGQHNREHADRNQGSVGWDQFPGSIGADFVQGTALRSLRQLQFPTKGRLYQSKGQTVARSSTVRSILASGSQKELRQAKAEREPGPGETLQRTKRSQVMQQAEVADL